MCDLTQAPRKQRYRGQNTEVRPDGYMYSVNRCISNIRNCCMEWNDEDILGTLPYHTIENGLDVILHPSFYIYPHV